MIERLRSLPAIQNLLLLLLLGLSGVAAQSLAPTGVDIRLWPIAVAAGLLGIVLGLLRVPDSVSHLVAIAAGTGNAVILAAIHLPNQLPGVSFIDRLVLVSTDIRDWYLGTGTSDDTDDMLVIILLRMIVWLISYLAAWSLARRNWITVALLLPGGIVAAARIVGGEQPGYLLECFLVVGVVLLARVTYLRRVESGERQIQGRRQGWLSLVTAAVVGVLVVWVGLSTPENFSHDTFAPIASQVSEVYLNAQDEAGDWIAERLDINGSDAPDIEEFPRYTAFDDAFSIGGELTLTDQPEVLVRTNGEAPYLTAQSYDLYNGRGWESTVEDTFNPEGPDGVRYSPELTFRANQQVPYSPAVDNARVPVSMEVISLTPSSKTVFTNGMYLTADERASVRMSWLQLEGERFPLREMDYSLIPPDLMGIVSQLLRAEELTVAGEAGLMYPSSIADRERLEATRAQLADRFIDVTWTVGDDGRVLDMTVTGQVPVYDDNVNVERTEGSGANDPYFVTSLQSGADESDLRAAGVRYPDWVADRYLQLPDTVTARTVELANSIGSGELSPYDQAKAIERYLRGHITYDLEVGLPPSGTDIVDYVLFEQPRGYCEHYATAMTVMLRILGIPARTVVGYFPADYDEEFGGYLYRQENAHAWTEAFFPGYGWIRFEPTSAQPESSLNDDLDERNVPPAVTPTVEVSTPEATPPAATPSSDDVEVPPMANTVPEWSENDGGGSNWWGLAAGTAVVALAGLGGWWYLTSTPNKDSRRLFAALLRWGRAGGVPGDATVTPREYARILARRYPGVARDANEIVDIYEQDRYGGRPPEPSRLERAAGAIGHLRREVLRGFFRRR